MLTRESILQANDRQSETVRVPEWGGDVTVTSMSAADRDVWENELFDMRDGKAVMNEGRKKYFRASLVARSVTDENGERLFDDSDIPALAKKNARAVTRLFEVAQRINGISQEDEDELLGKSTDTTGSDSSSE